MQLHYTLFFFINCCLFSSKITYMLITGIQIKKSKITGIEIQWKDNLGGKNVLGQEKAPPQANILLKHSKSKEVLRRHEPWEEITFGRGNLGKVLPQVLLAEGRELVHGAVFQGGRQVVPGLHHPKGEHTLGEFVSDVGRLQLWVQRVVSSEGPALGDGVEVSGAAEAPLEEHQVGVLQVHSHRHHLLLEGRRQVAAMDEVEATSVHALDSDSDSELFLFH